MMEPVPSGRFGESFTSDWVQNVWTRFSLRSGLEREYRKACGDDPRQALVRLPLLAFVFVCIFDPADQMFHAKVWLFVAMWAGVCILAYFDGDHIQVAPGLIACVLLLITVSLLSIVWYYLVDGTEPYAGFGLLKGFLLLSIAIVLAACRIDLMPFLSTLLVLLALLTIAVFVLLQLRTEMLPVLQRMGSSSGLLLLAERSHGEGFKFTQVNVVTLPLLTISIPYFFDRAMGAPSFRAKAFNLALVGVSILAMLFSGSRNLAAAALLLPFLLWPLYTRRKVMNGLISLGALAVLSLPFVARLRASLDPSELSNNIKLTLLGDYAHIFSDPQTLLLGKGLGAYYRWSTSGRPEFELTGEYFYFNTELTYAELIRYFGLFGAGIVILILLFPVAKAFLTDVSSRQRALALGWLAYLCMTATNPMLFSSTGMLLLSVMLVENVSSANTN
jgi:hypothetical protein